VRTASHRTVFVNVFTHDNAADHRRDEDIITKDMAHRVTTNIATERKS